MTNVLGTADDEELDDRTDAEYAADMRVLGLQLVHVSDRHEWERSRASGTALIPYGAGGEWYNSRGADPVADERRAWTSAYDFANGFDAALRKVVEVLHLDLVGAQAHQVADALGPSYLELRYFLVGDVECDPRVAMRIAFALVAKRNAWRRRRAQWSAEERGRVFVEPAEIGWI